MFSINIFFIQLLELLGIYQEQGSVLVFVEKQESADDLLKDLMKAGYDCISLHGGIDQYDRDSAVVDFKNGKIKLMVNYLQFQFSFLNHAYLIII